MTPDRPITLEDVREMISSLENRGLYNEARYLEYLTSLCRKYKIMLEDLGEPVE